MRYHIFKASRSYYGYPYCGPTSDNKPAEADTWVEAFNMAKEMTERNPVGFQIYDTNKGCITR